MRLAPSSSRPPPRSKVQNRDRARLGADRERLPVRVHARARFVPGAVEERERDGQPSVASVPRGVFSVVGVVVIIGDDAVAGGDGHDHRTERSHFRDRRGVVVQHREAPETSASRARRLFKRAATLRKRWSDGQYARCDLRKHTWSVECLGAF